MTDGNDPRNPFKGSSNDSNAGGELTPLERYLAKQKAQAGSGEAATGSGFGGGSGFGAGGKDPSSPSYAPNDEGVEYGAPPIPPSPPPSGSAKSSFGEPAPAGLAVTLVAAGFWVRWLAFAIDSIIVASIAGILSFGLSFALFFLPFPEPITLLSRLVVIYFYYGWFYSEKGASPGKMLLGLRVVETGTHRNLNYTKAFLRESVGKFISGAILLIGFIIAGFREDKRALHDLIFDSRVVKWPS
jgi:uncharacterized RDD family membrane protein YckC